MKARVISLYNISSDVCFFFFLLHLRLPPALICEDLGDEDIPNIPLMRANGPRLIVVLFAGAVIEEAVCVIVEVELIIIGALASALPSGTAAVFWLR